jgi:hypothetical protein
MTRCRGCVVKEEGLLHRKSSYGGEERGDGGGWAAAAGWGWRETDDGYVGEREERKLCRIV